MANDIKQRIVLEGEKEYNKALSDAKRNLKTLRSELKAETAELGANATAQQKNETRIKSLQKQIKEQEKIVKTYQEALKEVKANYGDNEDAVAKWEVKLNEARTALANMRNELEGVGDGLKNIQSSADMATVSTKSVADTFASLSEIGTTISNSIEGIFTSLISAVKDSVVAIWGEVLNIAAKADNYFDLAAFLGSTGTEVQKWDNALASANDDLNTVVNLISRLRYGGKAQKVTEWFGISDVNYKNDLEYFQAVVQKMFDEKEKMKEAGTWDNAMEDIFGSKKTQDIDGILSDWEDILAGLDKFNAEEGGFGFSEEKLKQLAQLSVDVATLKQSWESLRQMAVVNLMGDLAIRVTGNAQAIMDALLMYMNAEDQGERDEAIRQIEDNILAMFEAVKEAIEKGIAMLDKIAEDFKESDNPTVKAIGNILSGLVDALQWLTEDNMRNVVTALEILAAFWITGKGFEMGLKIASIVKDIAVIKAFGLGGAATGGAGAAASAAGGAAGGGWFSGLGSTIASAAGMAGKTLGSLSLLVGPFALLGSLIADDQKQIQRRNAEAQAEKERLEEQTQIFEGLGKLANPGYAELWNVLNSPWMENNLNPLAGIAPRYKAAWEEDKEDPMIEMLAEALDDSTWDELVNVLDAYNNGGQYYGDIVDLYERIHQMVEEYDPLSTSQEWTNAGGNAGNTDGLTSGDARSMTDAVTKMPSAVARSVSGLRVVMDGQTVGSIVAPYVSSIIAQGIQ